MLGLWASKRGEPFLCLHAEPCANFRDATVHQDPKRWACGRRSTASPSSVSTVKLTCTGRVLVGPCCIIYQREQATQCTAPGRRLWDHAALFAPESMPHIRPRESVEACCVDGASHTTEAHTITSTLETFPPGRWHHVAAAVAVAAAVFVSFRRAHHEQQEEHDGTRKSYVKTS